MTEATPLVSEQITQAQIIAFLNGAEPLEGLYFGDPHPSGRAFWWRRHLPALSTSPAPSGQGVSGEVERALIVAYLRRQSDLGANRALEKDKGTTGRAAFGGGSLALKRVAENIEAGEHISNDNAAPAPCAPGEVERLRAAVKLTVADASHHLRKWRPHCLEVLEAALSPQGLDAKEGGE